MRWRPALATALAVIVTSSLTACAGLPFQSSGRDKADAGKVNAPAAGRAAYRLEVSAPDDLRKLLMTYLDLARFQNAPETESITGAELDRLVAAAPAQARLLLETEGYFNAEVKATQPEAANGGPPLVRIDVQPGPRAVVKRLTIEAVGALQAAVEAGDAEAIQTLAGLRNGWSLKPGEPFRQSAWTGAKNATLARLRAEGYAAATWSGTTAQVDPSDNSVWLYGVADSGPLFHFGEMRVEGLQRYGESSVRNLATFKPGTPYSEKRVLDFQERLQKLGLFDGSIVEIDPDPAQARAAPVTVRVRESTLQNATFGAGYSANTGPRITLQHVHRRPLGLEWIMKNKLELGPDRKLWEGELTSDPQPDLWRKLVAGSGERLRGTDELRTAWTGRIGRVKDTERIERSYYAELTNARVESPLGRQDSSALTGNYNWVWRKVDSVLLPTDGITLSTQQALGFARSNTADNGPFARAYGRLTWYRPLGHSWYATSRIEAAQVFAKQSVGVPDTLLFRAGGDESVRGYGYRTLGPMVDGVVTSGRVLLTGSAEVARPVSAKLPSVWWAAFVDAGNAAQRWGDIDPVFGYGVGLRWRSPVGPLRVDLAYGEEVRRFRLHLSVGVAF